MDDEAADEPRDEHYDPRDEEFLVHVPDSIRAAPLETGATKEYAGNTGAQTPAWSQKTASLATIHRNHRSHYLPGSALRQNAARSLNKRVGYRRMFGR